MSVHDTPFAIITGASRGIGAEYARALASRHYDLLLVSRDEKRLRHLASELREKHNVEVMVELLDLSQTNAANHIYIAAKNHREKVDVLINNAGFGMYGPFNSHPLPEIRKMLHVHINTVVDSVRLFLPEMVKRGSGIIINVSSIAALFPIPYLATYTATKAFLNSFSESLAEEVRPAGVIIQACCPGQTDTGFHETAGYKPENPLKPQSPKEVVRTSLAALETNQVILTVGCTGKIAALVAKYFPRKFLARKIANLTCKSKKDLQ